jgi:DNA-binding Lrp family transcriptional regulator
MDRSDVLLCKELIRNSRAPYGELAKTLGMSIPAVHKRVRELMGEGVLNAFVTEIDITAVGGLSVMAFGRSEAPSTIEVADRLSSDDSTWMVLLGSGNQVFVNAFLRRADELEGYLDFFRKAGQVPEPTLGVHMLRPEGAKLTENPRTLSPLELRIVGSLHRVSRKQLSDVAAEIGVSARTVGNKLSKMIEDGKVRMTLDWRPAFTSDTISLFQLRVRTGADRFGALAHLREASAEMVVMVSAFSNIPDLIIATVWTPTMHDVEDVTKQLVSTDLFSSVVPHIIYSGRRAETWKDRLIDSSDRPSAAIR